MVRFGCPTCKAVLTSDMPGSKFACPHCGQRVQVPLPPAQAGFGQSLETGAAEFEFNQKHLGSGIASFLIAILVGGLVIVGVLAAHFYSVRTKSEPDGRARFSAVPDNVERWEKVHEAANRAKSMNNLKEIALAYHNYESMYRRLPATVIDPTNEPLLSWRVAILPFVAQDALYHTFKIDQAWDSPANRSLLNSRPRVYYDPVTEGAAPTLSDSTVYRTFVGPGTVYSERGDQTKYGIANLPDGTSNTVMAVEASAAVPWSKPEELRNQPGQNVAKLGAPGKSFFLVAMWDGSVRRVSKTVSEESLRQAIDPADGEPMGPDW